MPENRKEFVMSQAYPRKQIDPVQVSGKVIILYPEYPTWREEMIDVNPEPTPAKLDLDQALDDFRQKVKPLLDPIGQDKWDGTKLKEREGEILLAGLVLVGHCIAILISQLVLTESVKQAAKLRAVGVAGMNYTNDSFRWVTITLIGGVQVKVRTW